MLSQVLLGQISIHSRKKIMKKWSVKMVLTNAIWNIFFYSNTHFLDDANISSSIIGQISVFITHKGSHCLIICSLVFRI